MQKSIPPDVSGPQNQLVLFSSTPRTLLEKLGLILPYKNLFDHNEMRLSKYFQQSLKSVTLQNC